MVRKIKERLCKKMRVPKPPKTTLRRMMEEEEFLAKAAGCPPGHTYNPVIKKCLPGSPLSGITGGHDVNGAFIADPSRMNVEKPLDMENSPKKSAPKKIRMAGDAIKSDKSA